MTLTEVLKPGPTGLCRTVKTNIRRPEKTVEIRPSVLLQSTVMHRILRDLSPEYSVCEGSWGEWCNHHRHHHTHTHTQQTPSGWREQTAETKQLFLQWHMDEENKPTAIGTNVKIYCREDLAAKVLPSHTPGDKPACLNGTCTVYISIATVFIQFLHSSSSIKADSLHRIDTVQMKTVDTIKPTAATWKNSSPLFTNCKQTKTGFIFPKTTKIYLLSFITGYVQVWHYYKISMRWAHLKLQSFLSLFVHAK